MSGSFFKDCTRADDALSEDVCTCRIGMLIVWLILTTYFFILVGARPNWIVAGIAVEGNTTANKEGDIEDGHGGDEDSPASFRWCARYY